MYRARAIAHRRCGESADQRSFIGARPPVLLETLWRRKHARAGVGRGASPPRPTGARRPVDNLNWNVSGYSADGALLALVVVHMRRMASEHAVNERPTLRACIRSEEAACVAIALSIAACGGALRVIALVRPSGGP